MLKKLIINNFLSYYDKTEIEFHPGVNAITGTSDVGKSAVLKAMGWCLFNNLSGDWFKSWGKKKEKTSVKFVFDDADIIRSKKGTENQYRLKGKSTFNAIGTGVPEEIKNAINLNKINVQTQMEGSFLLSSSSSEVARFLNQAVNLGDIDEAMANVNKMIRLKNTEAKNAEIEVVRLERIFQL